MSTIALLQLPWADLERPSIQLGLISALLNEAGLEAQVLYANIETARRLGPDLYSAIEGRLGRLMGEWFFAQALFGDQVPDYLAHIQSLLGESPAFSSDDWTRLRAVAQDIPALIDAFLDAVDSTFDVPPAAVGISCTHEQLLAGLAFSRALKARHASCKVVLGGAQVLGPAGHALMEAFDWLDWVVDGEADEVVVPLFRALVAGDAVDLPHVAYGDNRGVITPPPEQVIAELDATPIPDYREYLLARPLDVAPRIRLPVELSRGCWWRDGKGPCHFCGVCPQTRPYRPKSSERVAEEIEVHAERSWLLDFVATDSVLSKRAIEGLRRAQERLDARIFAMVRPSGDPQAVRWLVEAGLRGVLAGIESLDSHLLEQMNKGTRLLDNLGFLVGCATYGLPVAYNLLYGIPGDAVADYRSMIALITRIHHLTPPKQLLRLNIERYSALFEEPEAFGIENLRPSSEYAFLFPRDRVDLSRVAYLFSGEYLTVARSSAMNELHWALIDWCEARMAGAALTVRRGPGFLEILDSRQPEQPRSIHVRGDAGRVLLACMSPKRRRELCQALELAEEALEQVVRELDAADLVVEEDDRLLALPVPYGAVTVRHTAGHTKRVEGGFVRAPYPR